MTRSDHDALYRRFFSDPLLIAQLLREFVAGPWLEDLDLDGLEPLPTKFHAETDDMREGDMIWRIPRRGGGDTYLMLLLEFQSKPDPWMALRVSVYIGLLWQFLVKARRLPSSGKLPPVLPVVVYNGVSRWQAPVALSDLIGLPVESSLWLWQPAARYYVVDEGAIGAADLADREGLPALLFRLETLRDLGDILPVADAILAWFGRHPGFSEARSVLGALLRSIMLRQDPDIPVPEDLLEIRNLLATRVEQWKQDWRLAGRQEGLQEGRQQGEAALLLRQLERRFGPLSEDVRDRVRTADTTTLEEWGERILNADRLADVLN